MDQSTQNDTILPGRYQHFKGNEYEVIYIGKHSETLEPMVVYRPLYGEGGIWVRPASMWNEEIEREGVILKRFKYMGKSSEKNKTINNSFDENGFLKDLEGLLRIALTDAVSGQLTLNPSIARVDDKRAILECDIRYPVTIDKSIIKENISRAVKPLGFSLKIIEELAPLHPRLPESVTRYFVANPVKSMV